MSIAKGSGAPRPVVAGVDGSDSATSALHWAVVYAKAAEAPLLAVTVWNIPTVYGWRGTWPEDFDFDANARIVLEASVSEVLGIGTDHDVTTQVVRGAPAYVLGELSRSASLVVVGSRGNGDFADLLLGSVAEFLIAPAQCPVAIIRGSAATSWWS